jgi:hypothetical protein
MQAEDAEVIVLCSEADQAEDATPGSAAEDGAAAAEGVASRSASGAAAAAAADGGGGSVKRPASEAAFEALCSATGGACERQKRPRLAGGDVPSLVAAGWRGLGELGGEVGEACMQAALDTWPGPEEPLQEGSLQLLDGLTAERCPALLQVSGEFNGVVRAEFLHSFPPAYKLDR